MENDELKHVGVLGMKWGHRRGLTTTVRGKMTPRMTTVRGKKVPAKTTIRGKKVDSYSMMAKAKNRKTSTSVKSAKMAKNKIASSKAMKEHMKAVAQKRKDRDFAIITTLLSTLVVSPVGSAMVLAYHALQGDFNRA